eukprot:scaffold14926_cov60-Phaeocystis_antarctica.AAC.3
MVGFLSKSFHAATGVKDLEGKFEVLLQGRYRFSVSFLGGPQTAPPPRATHITKACPVVHTLSSRPTTPAHDHATSPTARACTQHSHSRTSQSGPP